MSLSDVPRKADDPLALKSDGLARLQAGDAAGAEAALRRAAEALPADPEPAFYLGNLLLATGRPGEAADWFRRALARAPDVREVHNNLAAALLQAGDARAAAMAAERGLAVDDGFAPLHNTLGNALTALDQMVRAAAHYDRAYAADPSLLSAAVNRANILRDLGEHAAAEALYSEVLDRDSTLAAAHLGLGLLHQATGAADRAEACLRRALEMAPGDAAALKNLAILLIGQSRQHQALALLRDLTALHPDLAGGHADLGQLLQTMGRHDEAVTAFRRALAIDAEDRHCLPFLMQSLMYQCDWDALQGVISDVVADIRSSLARGGKTAAPPFCLAATDAPGDLRLALARHYSARCIAAVAPLRERFVRPPARPRGAKLRVGYVSPDFRRHSVGISFRDLLAAHDRAGFEWHGYALRGDLADEMTDEFARRFDSFTPLDGLTVDGAAGRIAADGIDVLIDLAGHTRHSAIEIFSLSPAPVQAHYLGYGATLGADCIPYLITDAAHTPPAMAAQCSERLIYLPDTFMAAPRAEIADEAWQRAECGLPEDGFVFACFNAHHKFDPETFAAWLRLLTAVDGSVLWCRSGTDRAVENLRRVAVAAGVDPARLVFAGHLPHARHLARHRLADLALDTRHHAGGVTTLDALWAGVPVLTIAGATQPSRTGASILTAAGLPELIKTSLPDYEVEALRLASEPQTLAELRQRLQATRETCALFDQPRLARHLESAYMTMWRRHADGLPPESFHVSPLPR